MSSKRIWIDNPEEKTIIIKDTEHNHIANVLRIKVGEEITVISGDEYNRIYNIKEINKRETVLSFIKKEFNQCNPVNNFIVYMSVIKPDALSIAVQKLNEIGATELRLFFSDYSVINENQIKVARLNEIAKQSCKQCGRSKPMSVSIVNDIMKEDLSGIVFLDEKSSDVKDMKNVKGIVVGPEGGFSTREREALSKIAMPVSFGKRILRAETAAIVGASKWCL